VWGNVSAWAETYWRVGVWACRRRDAGGPWWRSRLFRRNVSNLGVPDADFSAPPRHSIAGANTYPAMPELFALRSRLEAKVNLRSYADTPIRRHADTFCLTLLRLRSVGSCRAP
jgi:hypothetical protein